MFSTNERDLVGYGKNYPRIVWPGNAHIAVSLVVHYEEGAERSPLEGDDEPESGTEGTTGEGGSQRDFVAESFFEYGSRRGVWRLLGILERLRVKATFLCCGQALERNPAVAREITDRGHEPCGHGYRWLNGYDLSRKEEKEQIRKAVESIWRTTGQRPLGWNSRSPSVNTRELLLEEGGFLYDSDSYGDDLPYFINVMGARFLTIPYTLDVSDDKFWAVPQLSGFTSPENFFNVMKGTFDRLYSEGETHPKMMSVSLRPRIAGKITRAGAVERFIRYASEFPKVWFARRQDIAEWWLERYSDL